MNGAEDCSRRLEDLESQHKADHDELIRHNCDIDAQIAQGEQILKRLDEQDENDQKIKAEIFAKVDRVLWFFTTAAIGALLSALVYVVFRH